MVLPLELLVAAQIFGIAFFVRQDPRLFHNTATIDREVFDAIDDLGQANIPVATIAQFLVGGILIDRLDRQINGILVAVVVAFQAPQVVQGITQIKVVNAGVFKLQCVADLVGEITAANLVEDRQTIRRIRAGRRNHDRSRDSNRAE